jgi:hypothetical protein
MTDSAGGVGGSSSNGGMDNSSIAGGDQSANEASASLSADSAQVDTKTTADRLANSQTAAERISSTPTTAETLSGTTTPAAQATPAPTTPSAKNTCTIEARFNPIGPGYHHAYVTTTDLSGTDYFRGGPSAGGPSSGSTGILGSASGGSSSQSSGSNSSESNNSGNSSSPGSGPGGAGANTGSFGAIDTISGPYGPGTIDWNAGSPPTTSVAVEAGNCNAVEARLDKAMNDIEAANIPYNPLSTNSNATAREALERAGYPNVEPAAWAPGWNTQLP